MADLLATDARLRAQRGDVDGVCESCRAILNAGRSLGDDPFLISTLVRVACRMLAMRELERVLAQGEPSDDQLAVLARAIDDELPEPLLLYGLRGDRATFHEVSAKIEAGEVSLDGLAGDGTDTGPPKGWDHVSNLWAIPRVRQGHAEILDYLTEGVELAKLPPEEYSLCFELLEARRLSLSQYARLLLPPLRKVVEAHVRILAESPVPASRWRWSVTAASMEPGPHHSETSTRTCCGRRRSTRLTVSRSAIGTTMKA